MLERKSFDVSERAASNRTVNPAMTTFLLDKPPMKAMPEGRSWRRRRWLAILAGAKGRAMRGQVEAGQGTPAKPGRAGDDGIVRWVRAAARSPLMILLLAIVVGCQELPPPPKLSDDELLDTPEYAIAPLDTIQIFVWQAPDLSVTVPVRPDGRITMPLVEDMMAAGKSPTVLARDIENALRPFVQDPKASVVVEGFANQTTQMVKVIGEVARPVTVHYQMHMSVLDVMAEAQGLTEYAAGNDAKLIRKVNGRERTYQLKLNDLLDDGKMSANARLRPGDLIVVPKSLL